MQMFALAATVSAVQHLPADCAPEKLEMSAIEAKAQHVSRRRLPEAFIAEKERAESEISQLAESNDDQTEAAKASAGDSHEGARVEVLNNHEPGAGSEGDRVRALSGKELDGETAASYAFLDNDAPLPHSIILNWLGKKKLLPADVVAAQPRRAFRPFARWSNWANKPIRFGRSFGLILLSSILSWFLFPKTLDRAEGECAAHYWRCLGRGVLVSALTVFFMRCVLSTLFAWPMAIVLVGCFQLLLLLGLAVSCSFIGRSCAYYLRAHSWTGLLRKRGVLRSLELLIGTFLLCLLLQVGGTGLLPRLGTRLVALLAIVGLGALSRTRFLPGTAASAVQE